MYSFLYKIRNTKYQIQRFFDDKKSFTLIETLIVVAILAALSTTAFVELSAFKNKHDLDLDSEEVVSVLKNAQSKAIQQEGGSAWGVRFINTTSTDYYQIFQGSSYSSSAVVASQQLSGANVFTDPAVGMNLDVIFATRTGIPISGNAAVVVIKQSGSGNAYSIFVSSAGKISKILETGLVGYWPMDEGSGSTVYDASGNGNAGTITIGASGSQTTVAQAWANAAPSRVGVGLNFDGTDDYIPLSNIPVDTTAGHLNTVTFWMKWSGGNSQMPFGFLTYDLYFSSPYFGFNHGCGDLYGFSSAGLSGTWVFVAAIFNNGAETSNQIYINGNAQTLAHQLGTTCNGTASVSVRIASWPNGGYTLGGKIDDIRIYNRALSATEVQNLYNSY